MSVWMDGSRCEERLSIRDPPHSGTNHRRVRILFGILFTPCPYTVPASDEILTTLQSCSTACSCFLEALGVQRGHSTTLSTHVFDTVGSLMLAVLDRSHREMEYACARDCMIYAQTFSREEDSSLAPDAASSNGSVTVSLRSAVVHHAMWADLVFWEQAMRDAIDIEVRITQTRV